MLSFAPQSFSRQFRFETLEDRYFLDTAAAAVAEMIASASIEQPIADEVTDEIDDDLPIFEVADSDDLVIVELLPAQQTPQVRADPPTPQLVDDSFDMGAAPELVGDDGLPIFLTEAEVNDRLRSGGSSFLAIDNPVQPAVAHEPEDAETESKSAQAIDIFLEWATERIQRVFY